MTFIGFANQIGLLGLLSLPFILILHLLRQRRRHYEVSSLSLWSFLEVEVRGSRMQRIPFTLLLLLHLLIATLLSLAWAQPQVQLQSPVKEVRHILLLLDVSASMRARDVAPSRFAQAKADALALLRELDDSDTATVVAFGSNPTLIGDSRDMLFQELLSRLSALEAGEAQTVAFQDALAMLLSAPATQDVPTEVHVFTDAAFAEPDLSYVQTNLRWHVYGTDAPNQAVVQIAAQRVDATTVGAEPTWQVFSRLANFGQEPVQRTVVFSAGGEDIESATLEIPAGATVARIWETPLSRTEGPALPQTVAVRLESSDALPEDDVATLGLHNSATVRVGVVASDPGPVLRALQSLPNVDMQLLTPEEYLAGMSFDILFLRGFLPESWPVGTTVVFDPPSDSALLPLEEPALPTSAPVPGEAPLLKGIEFTGVRWGPVWRLAQLPPYFEPLLEAGSSPLLVRGQPPGSTVYLWLANLESGNLTRHPAFPVLVANLVNSVASRALPDQIATGSALPLPDAVAYPHVRLLPPDGEPVTLLDERPQIWTATTSPGLYGMELVAANGEELHVNVGVNAGNLEESAIGRGDWPVDQSVAVDAELQAARRILDLFPWLLAVVALLLLLEAVIAWR